MFDLPAAKRVRRADLYSPSSSPEPLEDDESLIALLRSKLDHVYGPIAIDITANVPAKNNSEVIDPIPLATEHNEGFEFRLFATPRQSAKAIDTSELELPTQRIILDEELAVGTLNQQSGFLVPQRDDGYYFTGAIAPERRKEFDLAAVSGEDVKKMLEVRYSGLAVPWRVRYLRNGQLLAAADVSQEEKAIPAPLVARLKPNASSEVHPSSLRKKGKPGKKRRIVLRVRKRKVEDAAKRRLEEAERKKKALVEKKEAEREKRTRRNREKKVKKKMKEREKKITLGGEGLVDVDKDGNGEREETS